MTYWHVSLFFSVHFFNIVKLYHIYNFPFLLKIISLGYFVDYQYLPKLSLIVVHLEFNCRSRSSQDVLPGGLNLTVLSSKSCVSAASSVNGDYTSQSCVLKGLIQVKHCNREEPNLTCWIYFFHFNLCFPLLLFTKRILSIHSGLPWGTPPSA